MTDWTEYAVYRFLDKNGYCHMISDNVEGIPLIQYEKCHSKIEKELFFQWIEEMARQLAKFYKWKHGKAYGYISPYTFIVPEDGKPLLLDLSCKENEELLQKIRKRTIRALFVRKEKVVSEHMEFADDVYGLGKTIQFLAAKAEQSLSFTRKEEKQLKKIIQICLEAQGAKAEVQFEQVQKEIKKIKKRKDKEKKTGNIKKLVLELLAAALILVTAVWMGRGWISASSRENAADRAADRIKSGEEAGGEESKVQGTEGTNSDGGEFVSQENQAYLQLGLVYMIELEDYEKAAEYLEKSGTSGLTEAYLVICRYLQKNESGSYIGRELSIAAKNGAEALREHPREEVEEQRLCQYPIFLAYTKMDTEEASANVVQLGEAMKEEGSWRESPVWEKKEKELLKYLAEAYERTEDFDGAIQIYEGLKETVEEAELELIYEKLELLYEETEQADEAWKVCKEAVERLPKSSRLWLVYIRKYCADSAIERDVCAEAVKRALQEVPELKEEQEFQKLQKEYEIKVEGETIWVGK